MERVLIQEKEKKIRLRNLKINKNLNVASRYLILILVGIIMIYPLLWLVGASFKGNRDIFLSMGIIPDNFDMTSYKLAWETSTNFTLTKFFMNTFKIVIPRVIFSVISSTLTAYAFTRFKFFGKKVFFALLIATLLLPSTVTRIPQFLIYQKLGWLDTYLPLVLPSVFACGAFYVFMAVQFMRGIPKDLDEAAKIDGCNSFQILIFILIPVLKPVLICIGLFEFMAAFNDYMGPLIYLSSLSKYPISIAVKLGMDISEGVDWNRIIATSVIALFPSITVFFMSQKYFIDGVAAGAVKE